jgi:hypothetical protein
MLSGRHGLRVWGSPVTQLYGVAFGLSSAEGRRQLYAKFPKKRTS